MEQATAPGGDAPISAVAPAPADNAALNVADAAKLMRGWRDEQAKPKAEPQAQAPAEPPPNLAETPDSDPPQEAPAETTDANEPAELPPIEPPRSWTKEEKEEFATYPREAQEKISRREQDRETALRRSQNEAADAKKAVDAKLAEAERVRQQYEQALPMLLQSMQQQQMGEFSDIKTMDDVERLAREDWPRYILWDAQQKKIAAVAQEVQTAQARQDTERRTQWSDFVQKEDAAFVEKVPELKDRVKAAKVAEQAAASLKNYGFTESELSSAWNGEAAIPLRDHRMQLILLDAVKYNEAKAAVAKAPAKPVPPVQRPGVAKAPGAEAQAKVDALSKQLSRAKGIEGVRIAAQLLQARRAR